MTAEGTPLARSRHFSRRDFLKITSAGSTAGLKLTKAKPFAAQRLPSSEQELLNHTIEVAMAADLDYGEGRVIPELD